ncbi:MAG TPA: HEAT repeat domain-containing protein, partial [Planctomycetota bacterium]|nr:HEAT repeat domain-containing protein [Planctomycetota bacterium]
MKKLFSILLLGACALAPAAARAGEAKAADPMKELQAAVNAKDKTAFIKALTDLGNEGTEKAAQMILNVALSLDSLAKFPPRDSNDIFDAAESALANVKDPKGEKLIYEDLKKDKGGESWKIRVFLCDVVAKKRTPEAEDALVAAVKDKNPTVQKTAISHLLL